VDVGAGVGVAVVDMGEVEDTGIVFVTVDVDVVI
jgi:hypothetical protein